MTEKTGDRGVISNPEEVRGAIYRMRKAMVRGEPPDWRDMEIVIAAADAAQASCGPFGLVVAFRPH